jgi:hypothetical protein
MLKRFILWDYKRGSWQYDVFVGIILAFIFLTPRAFFRDQARIGGIATLRSDRDESSFFVDAALLEKTPENERVTRLGELLPRTGPRRLSVTRVEPIVNSEGELQGYMVYGVRQAVIHAHPSLFGRFDSFDWVRRRQFVAGNARSHR